MTYYNLKKLCVIRPVINRSCDFRRKNISYVRERDDHADTSFKKQSGPLELWNLGTGKRGSSAALDSRNQKRRKVEHGVTQQCSQKKSSSEADHGHALNERATKEGIAKQKKASISFEDREKLRKEVCSHLGTLVRGAAYVEVIDIQLSPKRALRAAILKSRFADIIIKAQHETLSDHGDPADRARMQKEKEGHVKKQRQEKTGIETEARTAVKLKMQREKEREAARIALQMVEKTVQFDDNIQIMKELEMFLSPCIGNPLERLGLFLKPNYSGDDEDEDMVLKGVDEEAEEGEIIS